MHSNGGLWNDLILEHKNKPRIALLFQAVGWWWNKSGNYTDDNQATLHIQLHMKA